jgi:hypothetical protein
VTTAGLDQLRLELDRALSEMRLKLEHYQPAAYDELEMRVLEACRNARAFHDSKAKDRNSSVRERDRKLTSELPGQIAALKSVLKFIARYPQWAEQIEAARPRSVNTRSFASEIEVYKQALENQRRLSKRGAFAHRFTVGPLVFPKPIDKKQGARPGTDVCLLFELTLYFRRFSDGLREFASIQSGEPMHKAGHPHYEVSALLIAGTLSQRPIKPDSLRRKLQGLMQRNPNIGLGDWPSWPGT